MKKRLSFIVLGLLFSLGLSSCQADFTFSPFEDYLEPLETKKNVETDIYYSKDHYESLSYEKFDGSEGKIETHRDLFNSRVDNRPYLNMNNLGEEKVLVIPVSFTDSQKNTKAEKLNKIKNAFFGKENLTAYESVASFYNKSSYGHFKLNGEVSDWFDLNLSSNELKTEIHPTALGSRYVASLAIEWYLNSHDDLASYDLDDDGFIDGLYLVYDYPYKTTGDLFWAYTDRMNRAETFMANNHEWLTLNTSEIAINGYVWASIDFLKIEEKRVDSRVFSHESGHLLGLLDYYSPYTYQPTGFMDLMDSNLGDHTGWSKMILNWLTPKVMKNPGRITLKSFTNSGELILIPSSEWNGTPYDEFLLLEFYTPNGLNGYDTKLRFTYQDENGKDQTGHFFSKRGLKVYHVDARIGYFDNHVYPKLIASLDDPNAATKLANYRASGKTSYYLDFLNSNSVSNLETQKPLYHLLEKSGENSFIKGLPATDDTLFFFNDSFGYTTFSDFAFNNGGTLKYKFKITAINSANIQIVFESK